MPHTINYFSISSFSFCKVAMKHIGGDKVRRCLSPKLNTRKERNEVVLIKYLRKLQCAGALRSCS